MLIAHHSTASAITPHAANRNWIVFLQTALPASLMAVSPIRIAGMRGADIGRELRRISAANAYDVLIIGLIPTTIDPDQHAKAIADQYAGDHLHDAWYAPSPGLLAFIEHHARRALQELLAQVHPGAISEHLVDIHEMARILGVSEVTVRRMVKAEQIPFLQARREYRFQPVDVIAALHRHRR